MVEQHGPLPVGNFWQGRDGQPPDKIVLHTMVGWIAGADARFHNPTSEVSAHFGVRVDGSLWQWVDVWDTAYHAGDFTVNLDSIGIEHEDGGDFNGVRPDALYTRSAELVAQFCREYDIPCVRGTGGSGIYDHRQVHATACPDALDTDRIIREANALLLAPAVVHVLAPTSLPDTSRQWAQLYALEAPRAGVSAGVALAQAIKETGNFTFTGIAQPEWNNPAGLGVTGAPGVGNRFLSKHDGVIAHLQHLLMYFTPAHTPYCFPTVDQRHFAHRGYPDDLNQLDGHWAIPGVGYGASIAKLVPQAQALLN